MGYSKFFLMLLFLMAGFPHAYAEIEMGTPSKFMRHEHDQIYARIERLAQTRPNHSDSSS